MTESHRIYLSLLSVALVAVAIAVAASFWLGGITSVFVSLLSLIILGYLGITSWAFGNLAKRLESLDANEAQAARDAFFELHPWLRRER